MTFAYSPYIDLSSITDDLQRNKSVFTVFSLNIQSINSKFSQIQVIISQLNDAGLHLVHYASKKHGCVKVMIYRCFIYHSIIQYTKGMCAVVMVV